MEQLEKTMRQIIRFAGVGVVGTTGHYLILVILVELISTGPVVGSGAGFAVGAIINYWLNRSYTFESSVPHIVGLPKFLSVAAVGMLINTSIMAMAVTKLQLQYLIAQIVATAIVLIWNFLGNKFWTFDEFQTSKKTSTD